MVKGKVRFLVLSLIFVFSINMCSFQSFADNTGEDIIKSSDFKFEAKYGTITGYLGNGGDIEIPENINDIKVIGIGDSAFENCTNITGITIPDTISKIGNYAFKGCSNIKDMTLPGSITSLGESIFLDCNLDSLTISKSLKGIWGCDDEGTLAFCKIKTIILEEGTTAIQDGEFVCCDVETIKIPDSVTTIGEVAFFACSCKEIIIPEGVTSIGPYAFGQTGITEITIPDSITNIGDNAFYNCSKLKTINVDASNKNYSSVDGVLFDKKQTAILKYPEGITETSYSIPEGVTSIGDYAFYKCYKLTSLSLPSSLISIGKKAFGWCSFNSIIIPDGVTSISRDIFTECDNLSSITIPTSVTYIDEYAFFSCHNLTIVTYPGTYAEEYAKSKNLPIKYITDTTSPNVIKRDINGDGVINMIDIILIAAHFNTVSSDKNYDKKCDINNDGCINMSDIMIVAEKFNQFTNF